MIEIYNLKKSFGSNMVINIPHLKIKSGQITAIIGPSGAGKSTLISLINGLTIPTEGRVVIEGDEFSVNKDYKDCIRKNMTMVFQEPVMFKTTLKKNIQYGLKIRGLKDFDNDIFQVAKTLGLEEKLNQSATTLSGGEASRAALARAIVIKPRLLLLDEPTSNLDPQNVYIIETALMEMQKMLGNTILVVTHNMFQAKRIADNIIFILNGEIIECGMVKDIFERPKDIRTARFISGDMVY